MISTLITIEYRQRRAKSSALVLFFLGFERVMVIVDARTGRPCRDGSDIEIGGCHHPNSRRTRVRRFLALCTKGSGHLAESGCFPELKWANVHSQQEAADKNRCTRCRWHDFTNFATVTPVQICWLHTHWLHFARMNGICATSPRFREKLLPKSSRKFWLREGSRAAGQSHFYITISDVLSRSEQRFARLCVFVSIVMKWSNNIHCLVCVYALLLSRTEPYISA